MYAFRVGVLAVGIVLAAQMTGMAENAGASQPAYTGPAGSTTVPGQLAGANTSTRGLPFRLAGKRWPGRVITVDDRTRGATRKIVTSAMRLWNRSGAKIRFKRRRRGGKLIITTHRVMNDSGYATVGYARPGTTVFPPNCPPGTFVEIVQRICPGKIYRLARGGGVMWLSHTGKAEYRRERDFLGIVAVHELGHVLGLEHLNSSCLVMNTRVGLRCGPNGGTLFSNGKYTMCRIPMPGDVRGVVKRYGGKIRIKPPKRNYCEKR